MHHKLLAPLFQSKKPAAHYALFYLPRVPRPDPPESLAALARSVEVKAIEPGDDAGAVLPRK
jgi:hypothetical protein